MKQNVLLPAEREATDGVESVVSHDDFLVRLLPRAFPASGQIRGDFCGRQFAAARVQIDASEATLHLRFEVELTLVLDQHGTRLPLAPLTRGRLEVRFRTFAGPLAVDGGFVLESEAHVHAGDFADGAERISRLFQAGVRFRNEGGERRTLDGCERFDEVGRGDCLHAPIIAAGLEKANVKSGFTNPEIFSVVCQIGSPCQNGSPAAILAATPRGSARVYM